MVVYPGRQFDSRCGPCRVLSDASINTESLYEETCVVTSNTGIVATVRKVYRVLDDRPIVQLRRNELGCEFRCCSVLGIMRHFIKTGRQAITDRG